MNHGERREPCPVAARPSQGLAEGAMEGYTFWREREARFRELAERKGALDLHAFPVEVDLPALLDASSEQTRTAIANLSATPESIYAHARSTARVGRILLDGEQADRWILSGGPSNKLDRTTLENNFRAEAMMAAVGAGEADAATTDQAAVEAWLDLIARKNGPYRLLGGLERLAHASIDMCRELASRAYRDDRAEARQAVNTPPKRTAQRTRFPNRAAWLEQAMKDGVVVNGTLERHLTPHRIRVLDGPDKATTARILRCEPVRKPSLDKLATALKVSRQQIPDD